ncbi:Uncharacterised protein [Cedecea neteri]|uniref:Uncharacterized protein n=1 Tax=Cedecea neteri TaxID=158822 RepID=A0A291E616_9ENTR|nr:three component ABC system middle component [Cedecea neteri]ATF95504.1 hypothetical protein CO704_25880 [Cedecea neteri]SQC92059.1 Uncharacterised protein [Cedecea neteri]
MKPKAINHLFTLQRSPILLAPCLHQFYEKYASRERDLLLSYLVLPMLLSPPMQTFLIHAKGSSSLRTMCSQQSRLLGLTHLVQQNKSLTHASLLFLQTAESIEITDSLSVKSLRAVDTGGANPVHLTAASRLAILFAEVDIVTIYRTLGFKSL